MSILSAPYFHNEAAAFVHLESVLWAGGPTCPHCGNADASKIGRLQGKSTRLGVRKCYACRKPFTVKVGTVFESAHIPLHKMLQAVYLLTSSKKGFSAHQLHRTLGITYKSAWFLAHRIREAMRTGKLAPMGGAGRAVEADETYLWNKEGVKEARPGVFDKRAVLALVERHGEVRMFHVERADAKTIRPIVEANVARESALFTDESTVYPQIGAGFAVHATVNHAKKEYARGPVTTNTAEGVFSIFKRGMRGVYQHCAEHHLHRYLAEFEFRYNARSALGVEDVERSERALSGISGKRLLYRDSQV
jgi:transposase-like protein